jgi:hypothetical protein
MWTEARLNANLVCLQKAVLCANCDVISEGSNGHCAACGSQALLSLSKLLGGTMEGALDTFSVSTDFANAQEARYLSAAA